MSPKVRKAKAEALARDYVMARLVAARQAATATIDAIDEAVGFFVDPDDDDDGEERAELIATALESAGCVARALECAEQMMERVDPEEGEPWDDDDSGDDEEDDEEGD